MRKANITRRLVLSGGIMVSLAQRSMVAAAEPATRSIDFVFERNRATVMVRLAGKGPFRFLIDSGSHMIAIDQRVAKAAGLVATGETVIDTAAGAYGAKTYKVSNMIIGDTFGATGVELTGSNLSGHDDIHGLLPLILLPQCEVDFVNRRITAHMTRVPTPRQGEMDMMVEATPSAKIRGNEPSGVAEYVDRRPMFNATLDGKALRVLLDTGLTQTLLINSEFVSKYKLWDAYGPGKADKLGTPGGNVARARRVYCKAFSLGHYSMGAIPFDLSDPSSADTKKIEFTDAVVGMELLRRFDMWVDGMGGAFGLKPNALFHDTPRIDRSGLWIDYPDDTSDTALVLSMNAGGPGDRAGLKIGDQVLAFSSTDGGDDLTDLHWALSGPPGSQVAIKVKRGDAEKIVTVVLEEPK